MYIPVVWGGGGGGSRLCGCPIWEIPQAESSQIPCEQRGAVLLPAAPPAQEAGVGAVGLA